MDDDSDVSATKAHSHLCSRRLFHHDHASESHCPLHHGLFGPESAMGVPPLGLGKELTICIVGLLQREFLDHAVDILQLGELNRFLRVDGVATRPAMHREPILDLVKCQLMFHLSKQFILPLR
jgi:hypothetical protein